MRLFLRGQKLFQLTALHGHPDADGAFSLMIGRSVRCGQAEAMILSLVQSAKFQGTSA